MSIIPCKSEKQKRTEKQTHTHRRDTHITQGGTVRKPTNTKQLNITRQCTNQLGQTNSNHNRMRVGHLPYLGIQEGVHKPLSKDLPTQPVGASGSSDLWYLGQGGGRVGGAGLGLRIYFYSALPKRSGPKKQTRECMSEPLWSQ